MQLFSEIRRRIRYLILPVFWLVLTFYFGYHAVNGERGLRRLFELKQEIQATNSRIDAVNARIDKAESAEHKVMNAGNTFAWHDN